MASLELVIPFYLEILEMEVMIEVELGLKEFFKDVREIKCKSSLLGVCNAQLLIRNNQTNPALFPSLAFFISATKLSLKI